MVLLPLELAVFLGAWWLLTLLYALLTALVGTLVGLTVKHVTVGFGPVLLQCTVLDGTLQLRLLPWGCVIVFRGHAETDETWTGKRFLALPLALKAPVLLIGPLFSLLLGVAVLLTKQGRLADIIGFFGLWTGLLNLLPLPALHGGTLLLATLPATYRQRLAVWQTESVLSTCVVVLLASQLGFLWLLLIHSDYLLMVINRYRA